MTNSTATIMHTDRDGEARPLFIDPFFQALKDVRDCYQCDRAWFANTQVQRLVPSAEYNWQNPGETIEFADFWVEIGEAAA